MKYPYTLITLTLSVFVAFALFFSTRSSASPNSPPITAPDSYTVHGSFETAPGIVAGVLLNDSDPDGDQLHAIFQQTQTSIGTATIFANGKAAFIPASGQTGTVTVNYTACDPSNACTTGSVTFIVVNQTPVAGPDEYYVFGDSFETPLETPNGVLKNDIDPDGDQLQVFFVRNDYPQGSAMVFHNGKAAFVRNPGWLNYEGTFSINYPICDNLGACSQGTVTFTLLGNNANDGTSCLAVGRPVNVTNGNVFVSQTDFQLPGAGPAIDLTRTYNSNAAGTTRLFGRGWSTAYDESVTAINSNLLRLNQADGRAVYFTRPTGTSGAFLPLPGDVHGQIVQSGSGFTLTYLDGTVHQFNTSGKLLSLTDRNGNQTTLAYNLSGKLSSVTDPFGRGLFFLVNLSGRVTSIADTTSVLADYTYGANGELLTVTYPDNSQYVFTYDGLFRLTFVKDALNNVLESHTYDSQGRGLTSAAHGGAELYTLNYFSSTKTRVTDALGRLTEYTFENKNGRNVVTKVEGNCSCGSSQVKTWTFDSQLNMLSETDALNRTTTYTYDANGNVLTATDFTGTITYTYNSFGQELTETDQMGGVTTNTYSAAGDLLTSKDALNNTTTYTYDSRGQVLTVTDARNKVTTFTWDTSGRLSQHKDAANNITTFTYDLRARPTSVTNALNQTTTYEYDAAGRLKKLVFPDTNFAEFTYDLAGRRTKVKDARGNETTFAYDNVYRLTSQTDAASHTTSLAYDVMSNLTSRTDALSRVTNYEYDDFNRLKKIIHPPDLPGATRQQELFEYDAVGNVTKKTDTAGRDTTFLYDAADRLTRVTDPALQITQFEYNARSHRTKVIDALSQQYVFGYDALGRLTQVTRGGISMSNAYDAVGNRTQRTDYNGAITNYTFDDVNRLTSIAYPDSTSATYGYDAVSRLTSAANQNGTVTFAYDALDRITSTTDVWGRTIGYGYDANGNRTSMTVGGSSYATYQYDSVDRLMNLADSASQNFVYSYNAVNRLTSRVAPNGVTTSMTYDGLDRLFELAHTKSPATLAMNQYGYNTANKITTWLGSSGNRSFNYDASDRLLSVLKMGGNESYTYDAVGNRSSSHLSATYGYQPFNKLTSTAAATYTYDNNGNMLSKTDGSGTRNFAWDSDNRLKQVTLPGGLTVNYKYDAIGRRIQRTTSAGADERYVYDGHNVLLDLDSSLAVTTSYLNGPGLDDHLRQTNVTTGVSYFLTDHQGSTSALTDSTGNVVETLSYDSFGNNAGSARTRYTYTGRERDPDTGLLYYRARFYDPQLGRFMSEDPIGLAGGINFYAYVGNSPVNYIDPWGLQKRTCKVLIELIWEAFNMLQDRASDLINDPQNLQWSHWSKSTPHPRFGSIEGHQEQYEGWRKRLSNLLDEWKKNCEGKGGPRPPSQCWKWRNQSAPNPIRRGNPATAPPLPQPKPAPHPTPATRTNTGLTDGEKKAVVGVVVGVGTGYIIYRVVRMTPSLAPPLWWTIPINLATP
ncbi:MAG TPA: RHS repeat-associated core domain-containing protein [Pyrinomonadaceae bacterium]|nr:RHS repeat-associated core domain-containing protein [Pyrinomonadaceae bacterium]